MKTHLISLCVAAIIALASATDYCAMSCKDYSTNKIISHIGCNHNKRFDASCPTNAKLVTLNDSLKKHLVDAHNDKRNFIAGGGDAKHSPACHMATMEWDEELASLAALNVKQCAMKHDQCHNTDNFKSSGQNLFRGIQSPPRGFNNADKLSTAVNNWFNEVKNSKQAYIDSFPENYSSDLPAIGHFTVMMADRNIRLGCAAATYIASGKEYYSVACNYATTNIKLHPVYAKCKKAGTSCKTGKNPKYPNLCSASEYY